jgi:hypothetical protein
LIEIKSNLYLKLKYFFFLFFCFPVYTARKEIAGSVNEKRPNHNSYVQPLFILKCSCFVHYRRLQPNNLSKHWWQYGLSFCSLKVPLLSCFRQKAQTKCSGWNFLNMAVIQRPVMGFEQPAHNEPRLAW